MISTPKPPRNLVRLFSFVRFAPNRTSAAQNSCALVETHSAKRQRTEKPLQNGGLRRFVRLFFLFPHFCLEVKKSMIFNTCIGIERAGAQAHTRVIHNRARARYSLRARAYAYARGTFDKEGNCHDK